MNTDHIDKALTQKFITEDHRLVFWHDPESEFADYVHDSLPAGLAAVQVLDVATMGTLAAKYHLEQEDKVGKYLVYSTGPQPVPEEDWLHDIRLYSARFFADVASLWLGELNLESCLYLRDHLKRRSAFMGAKDRRRKLSLLVSSEDDEESIDAKMVAVMVGSQDARPESLIQAVCHKHVSGGVFDLTTSPEVIATLEKMGLLERFWAVMQDEFGYTEASPTVAGLLRRLFMSELLLQLQDATINALAQYKLPAAGARNAMVCLTHWRDSNTKSGSYQAVARALAAEQSIKQHLGELDLSGIDGVFTFFDVEKLVARGLKNRLLDEEAAVDAEAIAGTASRRKGGYWLSGAGRDHAASRALSDAYDAIVAAAELFVLQARHRDALRFESPAAMFTAYQDELYRLDQLYRRFHLKSGRATGQGWDLLKGLAVRIEEVYHTGYLEPLGRHWSKQLDDGVLREWTVEGLPSQQCFYDHVVATHLKESDRKRAFVIISDAFRYEAAAELVSRVNGRYRLHASLRGMLGVVPSYTALGMASLLPHDSLSYGPKGEVLVDGASTQGIGARGKILAGVDGLACAATDLMKMTTDEARDLIGRHRVVYIYHDTIDSRGDTAATEDETFVAVESCIDELSELAEFVVNRFNASKVWITADHGFLFQVSRPTITEKSKLETKPDAAVVSKKRYVIGPDLGSVPEVHHGNIEDTAGATGGMEFWIPRGANRFYFTGGARFVHGGAMPQEVLVPVVTVKQVRGKGQERTRTENVTVVVLGANHKITTARCRFEVLQTEPVGDRRAAITLRCAVYDGAEPVTTVESVVCDSTSGDLDDRKKQVMLELRSGTYDKSKPYRFVLRDAETDAEILAVPVIIDRSFDDDF